MSTTTPTVPLASVRPYTVTAICGDRRIRRPVWASSRHEARVLLERCPESFDLPSGERVVALSAIEAPTPQL